MANKKAHWENIYSDKKPHEVSWFQNKPALSLQLINNAQLQSDEAIIDVGGGASTLMHYLLDAGYTRLSVLDISAHALTYAQKKLGKQAGKIEWYEQDITRFEPPHRFSLWHDRAVFHFLTDEKERNEYISVLRKSLKLGGHLIIAAFAIGGPTQCSGLDIVQYDATKLLSILGDEFQLIDQQLEFHQTPNNQRQQFNYFLFNRK